MIGCNSGHDVFIREGICPNNPTGMKVVYPKPAIYTLVNQDTDYSPANSHASLVIDSVLKSQSSHNLKFLCRDWLEEAAW